jgi:hypothetical protein
MMSSGSPDFGTVAEPRCRVLREQKGHLDYRRNFEESREPYTVAITHNRTRPKNRSLWDTEIGIIRRTLAGTGL